MPPAMKQKNFWHEQSRSVVDQIGKFWYESGHTIAEGHVFEVRHRDMPFQDFSWVDFSGYDVTKEKPKPLNFEIIGEEDSLFSWVRNLWPLEGFGHRAGGWLACDDGSMEIADFVHLDDISVPPRLSLIHVKASDSASPTRGVSVSDYEVAARIEKIAGTQEFCARAT